LEPSEAKNAAERGGFGAASFGRIAYGAVGAGLMLCAIHFMLPQLRVLTKVLLPLPVALSYILFGPTAVLGLVTGGCLVLWGFVSLEQALGFAAGGAMLGVILGEHVRRGLTPFRTIVAGTLAISAVTLIGLQVAAPGSVIPGDEAALNSLFAENLPAEKADVFEQLRASIGEEETSRVVRYIMLVLPSLVLIGELLYVIVGFVALRALIRQVFGADVLAAPSRGQFRLWHAPDHLVFLVIAAGALLFLVDGSPFRLSLNCLISVGTVYVIQGLAVVLFFAARVISSRAFLWTGILITLLVTGYVFFPLVAAIGFLDVFIDFRKIRAKHTPQEQQGG